MIRSSFVGSRAAGAVVRRLVGGQTRVSSVMHYYLFFARVLAAKLSVLRLKSSGTDCCALHLSRSRALRPHIIRTALFLRTVAFRAAFHRAVEEGNVLRAIGRPGNVENGRGGIRHGGTEPPSGRGRVWGVVEWWESPAARYAGVRQQKEEEELQLVTTLLSLALYGFWR